MKWLETAFAEDVGGPVLAERPASAGPFSHQFLRKDRERFVTAPPAASAW
jgi:hypothetical protein